jgi:hypothetical protein
MADFTPQEIEEFEFRQRMEQEQAQSQQQPQTQTQTANDAKEVTSAANSVVYPAVGAVAGAAMGDLPSKIVNGMVKDPITGKWMAVENYARQMAQGKYYGGNNYNQVWDKIREFNADPTQGPRLEKEAMANRSTGQKVLSKIPKPLQGIASSPMGVVGRSVMGLGAGMQGADALNRYNEGDTSGAIISGIGALGTTAAMAPHPVARIVGTGVGLGAEGLNMFLDKLKNKKQMAKGGLVDEEDGLSKAEKAALKILKRKKKVKHLAGGGTTTTATGDSTFNNTNVGMPNIVTPAMGIDENGVSTPAPVQVWNERTGQYQSQEDTTPGVMPGPRGGLDGLLAGENPTATYKDANSPASQGKVWSETTGQWVTPGPNSGAMPSPDPYMPIMGGTTLPVNNPTYSSQPIGGLPSVLNTTSTPSPTLAPVYNTTSAPTQMPIMNNTPPPMLGGSTAAGGTQNLLNPQGAAQINPKVNFASAMRPGVKQNVFNKFGTPLNQIRQSPGTTPQAPSVAAPRRRLPRLLRSR